MNPKNSPYYTYIKPLMKNQYVKNYAGMAFAIITIIIFGFFAIRPTISVIIGLQKSISDQKAILLSLEEKSATLETARTNLQNLNPQTITKMNNLLPSNTDLAPLIEYLNSLANTSNASISALQFQPVPLTPSDSQSTSTTIQDVDLTFNLQGTYAQFQYIIQNLTKGPRLLEIQNLNLTRTNDNILILSVNAKAYFIKQ
jgi:Tfp pilus assembly protein PilO